MEGGRASPADPDVDVPLAVIVSLVHLNVGNRASDRAVGRQFSFKDQFKFHFSPIVIYIVFAVFV